MGFSSWSGSMEQSLKRSILCSQWIWGSLTWRDFDRFLDKPEDNGSSVFAGSKAGSGSACLYMPGLFHPAQVCLQSLGILGSIPYSLPNQLPAYSCFIPGFTANGSCCQITPYKDPAFLPYRLSYKVLFMWKSWDWIAGLHWINWWCNAPDWLVETLSAREL